MRRIRAHLRLLRRRFNRGRWFIRLLGLSPSAVDRDRPGLVIIQVDGLSKALMEESMDRGHLPFLRRLVRRDHYRVHAQYAGLPSSTPAVQAELFYGVKAAVPAFSFLNRETGRVERMYEPGVATRVQRQFENAGIEGLLGEGSAYSNNFTGGAAMSESHFCAPSLGWQELLAGFRPLTHSLLVLANIPSVLRVLSLALLESGLAVYDFARGVSGGRDFLRELKFVPTRIGISVVLREILVLGAKIDIERGLPVIHMNFLGYDEQAHRRGPNSWFARRSLRGIDYAIYRIWCQIMRTEQRDYDLWVYSDHGQTHATPYVRKAGKSIRTAVDEVAARHSVLLDAAAETGPRPGPEDDATQCLCAIRQRGAALSFEHAGPIAPVEVVGMGPVGFVYFRENVGTETLLHMAEDLVGEYHVPAVVVRCTETGRLTAVTADAQHLTLPQQASALCGPGHPFAGLLGEDLERLCRHEHAGELTLLGWRSGTESISFALENGSHGGITPEECEAFSLLPPDAPLTPASPHGMRAADLRDAARRHLGRLPRPAGRPRAPERPERGDVLRVMSYNTHGCLGTDGRISPLRIARVIARLQPDVIALQELDAGRVRSGMQHQAERIADFLEMAYQFYPSLHIEEGVYGNAVLSRYPMRVVRADRLPRFGAPMQRETRGALWAAVDFCGTEVQIINTHLGLSGRERMLQVSALLGEDWLQRIPPGDPLVLCGDLNLLPGARPMRLLRQRLVDVQRALPGHRPAATFYSGFPTSRIDHVLVDPGITVSSVHVSRSALCRVASDHLPLVADLHPAAAN